MAFILLPAMNQTRSVEAAGSVCKIDELSDAPCYSLCIPGKVLGLGTSLSVLTQTFCSSPAQRKGCVGGERCCSIVAVAGILFSLLGTVLQNHSPAAAEMLPEGSLPWALLTLCMPCSSCPCWGESVLQPETASVPPAPCRLLRGLLLLPGLLLQVCTSIS